MIQKETLHPDEIRDLLAQAHLEKAPVIASFMVDGKWRLLELKISGCSNEFVDFHSQNSCEHLKIEHPVGICIHLGHFKYLFDSTVQTVESQGQFWRVLLDVPGIVKQVQRRVYHRHPVPPQAKIKVLCWHQGYLDDSDNRPSEQDWQGILLNLSASGAQFKVKTEHKDCFRVGQVLGIQFTPLSYQKPLLLESYVKYLKEQSDNEYYKIGVEFLGLETSSEWHQVLDRILDVISQYEAINAQEPVFQIAK